MRLFPYTSFLLIWSLQSAASMQGNLKVGFILVLNWPRKNFLPLLSHIELIFFSAHSCLLFDNLQGSTWLWEICTLSLSLRTTHFALCEFSVAAAVAHSRSHTKNPNANCGSAASAACGVWLLRVCVFKAAWNLLLFRTHTYTQCTALYIYIYLSSRHTPKTVGRFLFTAEQRIFHTHNVAAQRKRAEKIFILQHVSAAKTWRGIWLNVSVLWLESFIQTIFFSHRRILARKQQICCAWRILLFCSFEDPGGQIKMRRGCELSQGGEICVDPPLIDNAEGKCALVCLLCLFFPTNTAK